MAKAFIDFNKKILIFILIFVFMINFSQLIADQLFIVNTQSETLSRYDTDNQNVQNHILNLGQYANQIYIQGNMGYVANSGEHNIQVIDLDTESTMGYIQCPNGSNPYWIEMTESGNKGYVTGLFTNSVYIFNPNTYEITGTISVGSSPEGLCLYENRLYVMNSAYGQSHGSVSVIDVETDTILETIAVGNNPQFAAVDSYGKLHVVCTGNYGYSTPAIWGKVYIINTDDYGDYTILDVGASPTRINISENGKVFLADGNGLGYIVYNSDDLTIEHSADNLFSSGGAFIAFDSNQNIYLGDALDWMNNGKVRIYDTDEVLLDNFDVGIAPVDASFIYAGNNSVNDTPAGSIKLKNHPNPFKNSTTISFRNTVSFEAKKIMVYNVRGQLVEQIEVNSEKKQVVWNAEEYSPGVYFYRLDHNNSYLRKMLKVNE
ncbi:MAG: T9SS type A sorting domain-containing protein [Candidatus Cloacimonetes bacterium]|nr:T9SS type A sorting domain-containing protein [Candidatus Cloacimonadota bacterium]MBS3767128.1 T9SS type A sorting domain-containing protein [Candidatus Cloacimonadota bacterium]